MRDRLVSVRLSNAKSAYAAARDEWLTSTNGSAENMVKAYERMKAAETVVQNAEADTSPPVAQPHPDS